MQIYVGDHRLNYVYNILFFTAWLSRFSFLVKVLIGPKRLPENGSMGLKMYQRILP